ncbi:Hypothetical predicted protein [Paramuricea clavata]|uniref:Uncharacterized protein n=1 Tax=Paramuricea clavata TaxID=317549 RepID=A0A6S7JXC6_PARCT|nr:Hypothetical predicted protein [Paramuricea clavata]
MVHIPRSSSQRGGGVGILHKDTLDLKITETVNTFASFECIERLLKLDSTWIRVVIVYRPPVSSVNALSVSMFLSEFSVYLENLVLLHVEVLIMGDFNFHTDNLTNHNACEFSNLLDKFIMSQHVSEPTHQSGNTLVLDLLIRRQDSNLINGICVHTPWISDHSIVQFKTNTKKPSVARKTISYRRWKSLDSPEDIRQFNENSEYYSHLLVRTRQKFYTDKIEANYGDQKVLFRVLDKLLHRENQRQFPPHDNLDDLTNMFVDFFVRKIDTIRSQLHLATVDNLLGFESSCETVEKLEYFSSVSEHQIENIIRLTNNKSCEHDPIPTWLLKQCIPALLPIITKIVNLSLHDAFMPTLFRQAFLTPILKNISLSRDEENSLRPISNLSYVSKLIEKVVDTQLTNHIQEHNLDESLQLAYKKHHSTETAWVRLHNDILS